MSQDFLKFMFCNFGLLSRLAQAGGGGAYYMNFHYQKVTTTHYFFMKRNERENKENAVRLIVHSITHRGEM